MMSFLQQRRNRLPQARLQLELLEDRQLLSPLTVINVNDSGVGSLRQAILNANAAGGSQTIDFSISTGAQTITLSSALPDITASVTIDGATQPGFAGKPIVELVGSGLVLDAVANTIRDLVIDRYGTGGGPGLSPGLGLWLKGNGNIITGNYIGTDITGAMAPGNAGTGIFISSADNIIGGATPGSGNVISGNVGNGISIVGRTAVTNLIEGNLIGTDATGHNPLANGADGIDSSGSNTIGGTTAGSGNVIAASGRYGIFASTSDLIEGNFIGTDITGTRGLGNGVAGLSMPGAASITIGGALQAAGNVISANNDGILIVGGAGTGSTPNLIENNFVGVAIDGHTPLGNSLHGILIGGNSGANPGNFNHIVANTIAYNGGPGIDIRGGVGNFISQNSSFFNAGLGIDLNDDGITANHANPAAGPNNFQNYPVLSPISSASGTTTISGNLNSLPNTSYTIEFFSNSVVDPSKYIEGKTYLGSTTVMTDGNGQAGFSFMTPTTSDTVFTATATDPTNDTSEFSQPQVINGLPRLYAVSPGNANENFGGITTLTLLGANFTSLSTVSFRNTPLATTLVNGSTLQATLNPSSLTREGIFTITVANPTPGGGTANALFTVLTTLPDGSRGTPNQRFVAQLYLDLLKRTVDATGLAFWTAALSQGASRAGVVLQIEQSQEYRIDEVQAIYQKYLHRTADSGGLAAFVPMLMNGSTVEQVAAVIIGSAEFFQIQGGSTTDGS
jgi:hypothetical protein